MCTMSSPTLLPLYNVMIEKWPRCVKSDGNKRILVWTFQLKWKSARPAKWQIMRGSFNLLWNKILFKEMGKREKHQISNFDLWKRCQNWGIKCSFIIWKERMTIEIVLDPIVWSFTKWLRKLQFYILFSSLTLNPCQTQSLSVTIAVNITTIHSDKVSLTGVQQKQENILLNECFYKG